MLKRNLLTVVAIGIFGLMFWACAPKPTRTVVTTPPPVVQKPVDLKTSQ